MIFSSDTWWLLGILITIAIAVIASLLKRTFFSQYDKIIDECREDIKELKRDYTPRATHDKDFSECRLDIKSIKDNYVTKEDFLIITARIENKIEQIYKLLIDGGRR